MTVSTEIAASLGRVWSELAASLGPEVSSLLSMLTGGGGGGGGASGPPMITIDVGGKAYQGSNRALTGIMGDMSLQPGGMGGMGGDEPDDDDLLGLMDSAQ